MHAKENAQGRNPVFLGGLLLILIWIFLFLEYALRVSDSVLIPELTKAFHIDAAGMGVLSSSYYIVYVLMQIPAGLLIDRFGIKRTVFFAMMSVALGALMMASATQLGLAIFARILMGFGSAFAFIATVKILCHYFKAKYHSFWIGIAMTVATLGAVFGQAPWYFLVTVMGSWRKCYYVTGFALFVVAVILKYLPLAPISTRSEGSIKSFGQAVKRLAANQAIWVMLLYVGLLSAPITVFAALWGIPFLTQGWHLSRTVAASIMAASWLGGLLGGPILGFLADYFAIHKPLLVIIGLLTALLMSAILFMKLTPSILTSILFMIGVLCNGNVIVFNLMAQCVSKNASGFATGLTNSFNMGGGPVFQILVGLILSSQSVVFLDHSPVYSLLAYQKALVIIPILLSIFSIGLWVFYKESSTAQVAIQG